MHARTMTTTSAAPPPAAAASAAPKVTPAGGSVLRRQCACGQHTAGGLTCDACARKKSALRSPLRRKAALQTSTAQQEAAQQEDLPPIVDEVLRGSGQDFAGPARAFMEARFARDFSGVRIHADGKAARSAQAVDALAYTVGRHIVFGGGRYAPETPAGASLLAHELTHVAQNAAGGATARAGTIGAPGDAAEHEAERVAGSVMAGGGPVAVRASAGNALRRLTSGQEVGIGVGLGVGALLGLGIAAAAGAFDKNDFTDDELRAYLQVLAGGKIEGKTDSDNKARALVRRLATGKSPFALSAFQRALLVREMLDGHVSDDDRDGIATLVEITPDDEVATMLAPDILNLNALLADLGKGAYADRVVMQFVRRPGLRQNPHFTRFLDWYTTTHFTAEQAAMARTVVLDVITIPDLDFADATEFRNEVFKRLRTSEMMQESQAAENGFNYPENLKPEHGCADYQAPPAGAKVTLANARVNKAARAYWAGPVLTPQTIYHFNLTEAGRNDGYKALMTLFEPQQSICDKTLIHCDYLVNVIQFRAFAETIGEKKFNAFVRNGSLVMQLNWTGFPPPPWDLIQQTPKTAGYRFDVRPRTRQDFGIGDQVVFTNHLAFDGLNVAQQSPWRLENAILIDKDSAGEDLFQGHGSGPGEPERKLLATLLNAYNALAAPAVALANAIDAGQTQNQQTMTREFPWVRKQDGKWVVIDPAKEGPRHNRPYDLKVANAASPETEPLLPGLRDPLDFSQFGPVTRPAESAPGKLYRPE